MEKIPTVLIVEDHPLLLIGLKISLEKLNVCKIIGEARNGEDAVLETLKLQPDVVLMDVGLPGIDGVEATWRLKHGLPKTRVIMFTSHTAPAEVSAALGAGADGYCSKDAPIQDVVKALRAVMLGQVWIDPLIAAVMAEKSDNLLESGNSLTELEVELLNLIMAGTDTTEIANRLNTSTELVSRLMHKIITQFVKEPSNVEEKPRSQRDSSDQWLTAFVEDLHQGKTFAEKYLLTSLLGSGGLGAVFKAKHIFMNRQVALKLLHPEFAKNRLALRNFQREAQSIAKLKHENIVGVHDFGMSNDREPYLVMEYIDGTSLSALILDKKVLSQDRVIHMALQICAGLSEAHKHGIVHCDLKPSNILIQTFAHGDTIKLVDFGLAQAMPRDTPIDGEITLSFFICGTPLYMSPEQCYGEKLDARSDIYSLGCIIYEALTGANPFECVTPAEAFEKQCKEAPPPMRSVTGMPQVSPELESCVLRMLAKDPAMRPQSAQEVSALLQRALQIAISVR
jgi:serine/threonine protein kinase/DNA-binding response OmpR family regulator